MSDAQQILVLWDIDRTLLYVGDVDRQVYRETFAEIVGRPAERLPARGTGVTMPLAIRSLLLDNGVPEADVPHLQPRMVELLPQRLAAHAEGYVPSREEAEVAVRDVVNRVPVPL